MAVHSLEAGNELVWTAEHYSVAGLGSAVATVAWETLHRWSCTEEPCLYPVSEKILHIYDK